MPWILLNGHLAWLCLGRSATSFVALGVGGSYIDVYVVSYHIIG